MKKQIFVGIAPTINNSNDKNPFNDYSMYVNTYLRKIIDSNAVPICLNYDKFDIIKEQLKLCDCFILPGNCVIRPQIFKIINYAYKNKIPVLGICLGMQELAIFSYLNDINNKRLIKEVENKVLYKLKDNYHHPVKANKKTLNKALQQVTIVKDSFLYECFKKEKIRVYSFHDYAVNSINSLFKIVAKSSDDVIEAIESVDNTWFCLGVQFHPELEKNNQLIKKFLEKVRVAKKQ